MIFLIVAILLSFLMSIVLTSLLIKLFHKKKCIQAIRIDGPRSHNLKQGTPTMGGIPIIFSTVISYFLVHFFFVSYLNKISVSGLMLIMLMITMSLIGLVDDLIKISKKQSLGLKVKTKFFLQGCIALMFAYFSLNFRNSISLHPLSIKTFLTQENFLNLLQWEGLLGISIFIIWLMLILISTTNAVNLSDGLDGLASGLVIIALLPYIFISTFQHIKNCQFSPQYNLCYEIRDPFDLSIITCSLIGALIGFIWWNCYPAKIFMGDTGSLGIGSIIGGLAIFTHTELLLIIIGGMFILISLSVIIQVFFFKITNGKRVFKMAPLQHHYELSGLAETTIVIRFWIIAFVFSVIGVLIFYTEWLLVN